MKYPTGPEAQSQAALDDVRRFNKERMERVVARGPGVPSWADTNARGDAGVDAGKPSVDHSGLAEGGFVRDGGNRKAPVVTGSIPARPTYTAPPVVRFVDAGEVGGQGRTADEVRENAWSFKALLVIVALMVVAAGVWLIFKKGV